VYDTFSFVLDVNIMSRGKTCIPVRMPAILIALIDECSRERAKRSIYKPATRSAFIRQAVFEKIKSMYKRKDLAERMSGQCWLCFADLPADLFPETKKWKHLTTRVCGECTRIAQR